VNGCCCTVTVASERSLLRANGHCCTAVVSERSLLHCRCCTVTVLQANGRRCTAVVSERSLLHCRLLLAEPPQTDAAFTNLRQCFMMQSCSLAFFDDGIHSVLQRPCTCLSSNATAVSSPSLDQQEKTVTGCNCFFSL
jgi:hypothetical protein